ncbi:MAG TPA: aminotransferase class I/II-fold pyridoxal phosphate-dependent enzyme, partial [Acidimicrobiales bacterium]
HGPGWLIDPLTRLKQAADLHTSTAAQRLVAEAVTRPGWLDGRAVRLTALYRHRAGVLASALRRAAGDRLTFAAPRGGMFLWARLARGRATDLLPAALARGVAFVPGAAFALADPPDDHLRLCFATLGDDDLRTAADRLAAALA